MYCIQPGHGVNVIVYIFQKKKNIDLVPRSLVDEAEGANRIWPDLTFGFVHKRSGRLQKEGLALDRNSLHRACET